MNNREIKFRFWDVGSKKMLGPYTIPELQKIEPDKKIVPYEQAVYPHKPTKSETNYDGYVPVSNKITVEPMQFTGLKDKNGKEIYEGDIIETPHKLLGKYKWQVIFQRGAFVMTDGIGVRRFESERFTKKYEVIGNIYENPELLK